MSQFFKFCCLSQISDRHWLLLKLEKFGIWIHSFSSLDIEKIYICISRLLYSVSHLFKRGLILFSFSNSFSVPPHAFPLLFTCFPFYGLKINFLLKNFYQNVFLFFIFLYQIWFPDLFYFGFFFSRFLFLKRNSTWQKIFSKTLFYCNHFFCEFLLWI